MAYSHSICHSRLPPEKTPSMLFIPPLGVAPPCIYTLLSSAEMCVQMDPLRRLLVDAGSSRDGAALFSTLYDTWCHSAGAVISLCLMSQVGHVLLSCCPA